MLRVGTISLRNADSGHEPPQERPDCRCQFKRRHFRVDVDSGPGSEESPSIDYLVAALRGVIKEHGAYGGDVERQ